MAQFWRSFFLESCSELSHFGRRVVSKQTKSNLRKAFGTYTKDNMHRTSVISTLPFNAKDSLAENVKLDFVMSYPLCLKCLATFLNMD
jgi:hypothetical protein